MFVSDAVIVGESILWLVIQLDFRGGGHEVCGYVHCDQQGGDRRRKGEGERAAERVVGRDVVMTTSTNKSLLLNFILRLWQISSFIYLFPTSFPALSNIWETE